MASTMRMLASNVQLMLKQKKDDPSINFAQIVYWCSFFIAKFTYQKNKNTSTGNYLSIYTNVPLLRSSVDVNPNVVAGRQYFELPATIFDINLDGGIDYIQVSDEVLETCTPGFTHGKFDRTTPSEAEQLYFNPYTTPDPQRPYWYRVGTKIYILGFECINVPSVEIGLRTVFSPFTECNLDDPLAISEDMIADVTKSVLELGRFALLVPKDTTNTGTENSSPEEAPKQRLVSLNQDEYTAQQQQQAAEQQQIQ